MSTPEERIAHKRRGTGFQTAKDQTYAFTCKGPSEGGGVVQDREESRGAAVLLRFLLWLKGHGRRRLLMR